ncbi:MAG TPA: hypothetical protein VMU81_18155, partial [Acetobacteraceae bacterium]|nr:hypothetical protein [Acetobacteraceae bacterium]
MRRFLCLITCLLAALAAVPAHAQPPSSQITATQAQQALEVLNDPAKRAAVTATLEAIIKAQAATSPATTATGAKPAGAVAPAAASAPALAATPGGAASGPTTGPVPAAETTSPLGLPLAPDSLGAAVLVSAAAFLNTASDRVTEGFRAAQGLPLLWSWLVTMATDPIGHMLIEDVTWRLAIVLAAAF